jgi:hypothetical protein
MKKRKVTMVNLRDLKPGPIRDKGLTQEQKDRIAAIRETFLEMSTDSLAQWLENFMRDLHPEQEIQLWEAMARAYKERVGSCQTRAQRKKLFGELLAGSFSVPAAN